MTNGMFWSVMFFNAISASAGCSLSSNGAVAEVSQLAEPEAWPMRGLYGRYAIRSRSSGLKRRAAAPRHIHSRRVISSMWNSSRADWLNRGLPHGDRSKPPMPNPKQKAE